MNDNIVDDICPIFNISEHVLTTPERHILEKGLSFVPTRQHSSFEVRIELLRFFRKIRLKKYFAEIQEVVETDSTPFKPPSTFVVPLANVSPEIITFEQVILQDLNRIEEETQRPFFNTSRIMNKALKELGENRNIEIKPADKGGGIVIWSKDLYKKEVNLQLGNVSNYKEIPYNPESEIRAEIVSLVTHAQEQGWINKKEATFLVQSDSRLPMFYVLPKIHKNMKEPPGRPIVSGIGSILEPLSQFTDFFLRESVAGMKSYVKDTTDMVNQIEGYEFVRETDFLLTMDIESLYTNIPQEESIRVVAEILSKRDPGERVPTQFILECIRLALTKNFFAYERRYFWQIKGTSMGATFAPSIANLYVEAFEETVIYPLSNPFKENIMIWKRYIDDILIVFRGTEDRVNAFHTWINLQNPHLQFTLEKHRSEINFLDLTIFEQEGVLLTRLFSKPTTRNSLLHYTSYHPRNLRDNLPFGQFLRIRRNCSQKSDYDHYSVVLTKKLLARGYPKQLIRKARKRAWYNPREALLTPKGKKTKQDQLVFVNTYSPIANALKKSINKNWHILNVGEHHLPRPLYAYKKGRNLRQTLVHTCREPVPLREDIGHMWGEAQIRGHFPCGNCVVCGLTSKHVTFDYGNKSWKLLHHTNCNSSNVIYVIMCPCKLQYVGQTTRKVKLRIGEHRSCIRRKTKGAPLVSHFLEKEHSEDSLKWLVIEQLKVSVRGGNMGKALTRREQYWIFTLDTVNKGLNEEIDWQSLILMK